MKHHLINRRFIGGTEWSVMIHLVPETPAEQKAVLNLNKGHATESDTKLINKYLDSSLGLGNYSIIRTINRVNTTFTLLVNIR